MNLLIKKVQNVTFDFFWDFSRVLNSKTLMNGMKYCMKKMKYKTKVWGSDNKITTTFILYDHATCSLMFQKSRKIPGQLILPITKLDTVDLKRPRQTPMNQSILNFQYLFLETQKVCFVYWELDAKTELFTLQFLSACILNICQNNTPDHERSFRSI